MPYSPIVSELLATKSWYIEKYAASLEHPLKPALEELILTSDYALKYIQVLMTILAQDNCTVLFARDDYFALMHDISLDQNLAQYTSALRCFRHQQLLRLLLLERAHLASTAELIQAWSDCADAIIMHSMRYCQQNVAVRYGRPRDEQGQEVLLFALAMGKLGGRELNYSSDIDLIFSFSASGETDGQESITNQQFFTKVVQQWIHLLHHSNAEGFVFRVDLRLRPNGDSGALVSSLAAMEAYYQEQGRDWERYAMVKARVITEDLQESCSWFKQLIGPFVYRRYVDFSVIDSLRSMKAMIEREVQLNPRLNDIKRGQGGIREIEFIIQCMQLIRGGRLPQLQQQNAMAALSILKEECLLPHSEVLQQAYFYLRRLENVLQSLQDQQIHALPEDPLKRAQVALAMGYAHWDQLVSKLHQYQRIVSRVFHAMLGKADNDMDPHRLLNNQLSSLWQGHIEPSMAINLLAGLGFHNAAHCHQMLYSLRHGSRCRRLSQAARLRLDRFMVILLSELMHYEQTDKILLQVIHLLEHIVGRSAYLALFTENPPALNELLFWFSRSPFITSLLVQQPFLLELLLDPSQHWHPDSRLQLEQKLSAQLMHCADIEEHAELLRQFKLTHWFLAARADLYQYCSTVRISQFLADVASVIVNQVFVSASDQLALRYPEIMRIKSHFVILAYGTLGSREMTYTSDLDLVFLYTAKPSEEALITRLTQKIMHMLTTRTHMGILFHVDTRLRPSGSAGLLVSHFDAFIDYQKNQAWIWEHQALLKARVIFGNQALKKRFKLLKADVLTMQRDKAHLRQEVLHMRARIDQYQEPNPVKHAPGGLLDLEFLVHYLILLFANPSWSRSTHILTQIKQLHAAHVLQRTEYLQLKAAYQTYHYLLHRDIICPESIDCTLLQKNVRTIWSSK